MALLLGAATVQAQERVPADTLGMGSFVDGRIETYMRENASRMGLRTSDTVYVTGRPGRDGRLKERKPLTFRREGTMKEADGAVGTDLLTPMCAVSAEIPAGNRWSIAASWHSPWVFRGIMDAVEHDIMRDCFQAAWGDVSATLWLGMRHSQAMGTREYRMYGHGLSLHLGAGYYDIGRDSRGVHGDALFALLAYRYDFPAGRKGVFKMGVSAGFGASYGRERDYMAGFAYGSRERDTLYAAGDPRTPVHPVPYLSLHLWAPLSRKEAGR